MNILWRRAEADTRTRRAMRDPCRVDKTASREFLASITTPPATTPRLRLSTMTRRRRAAHRPWAVTPRYIARRKAWPAARPRDSWLLSTPIARRRLRASIRRRKAGDDAHIVLLARARSGASGKMEPAEEQERAGGGRAAARRRRPSLTR